MQTDLETLKYALKILKGFDYENITVLEDNKLRQTSVVSYYNIILQISKLRKEIKVMESI